MIEVFTLLILFQLKHFLADYPLQTPYMLGKMKPNGEDWFTPLAFHTGVHSTITTALAAIFTGNFVLSVLLGVLDFIVHFIVDRLKASPSIGGRFTPDQPYFWWALGADQMAHHLTHYLIIYIIISQ